MSQLSIWPLVGRSTAGDLVKGTGSQTKEKGALAGVLWIVCNYLTLVVTVELVV